MILPAILASSLLGSLHCGAMCGPLLGLSGPSSVRLALVHAFGRLVTYTGLGLAAGAIGRAIDLAGELGAVQHVAAIAAAILIIAWGIRGLVVGLDPPGHGTTFRRGLIQVRRRAPVTRAWATGMLTGFLPCGWLWAFVVVAGGTGSLAGSAAVMLAFWAGTVPMMVGLMTFAAPLLARLRTRVPKATAIALVVLGLATLAVRWRDAGVDQVTHPHCHCAAGHEAPA